MKMATVHGSPLFAAKAKLPPAARPTPCARGNVPNSTARTTWNIRFPRPKGLTVWTAGQTSAILGKITRRRHDTFRATFLDTMISMITVLGAKYRSTAMSGIHAMWMWAGLRIASDHGTGSARGVGVGWTMNPGVSPRFTMDAGTISVGHGDGAQDRFLLLPFTAPRSSAFLAGVLASVEALALEAALAGSRWDSASPSFHGSIVDTVSRRGSTSTIRLFVTRTFSTRPTFTTSTTRTPTT